MSPDADGKVKRRPCHQLAPKVAADQAFQNVRYDTLVYKKFVENESFRRSVRGPPADQTGLTLPGNSPTA